MNLNRVRSSTPAIKRITGCSGDAQLTLRIPPNRPRGIAV